MRTSSSSKKELTFAEVLTIREYPIILGDNPACKQGAPIQIGWDVMNCYTRNLELYEYTRAESRTQNKKRLPMPFVKRSQMLLDAGYTREQIIQRVFEVADRQKLLADSLLDAVSSSSKSNYNNSSGFGKFSKEIILGGSSKFTLIAGVGSNTKPTKARTVTARTA